MPRRKSSRREPWWVSALPQLLEVPLLAQRVHGLEEAVVAVRHQLAVCGQLLEHLALERRVGPGDVVQDGGLEDEEAAIDPSHVDLGLLREAGNAFAVELDRTE